MNRRQRLACVGGLIVGITSIARAQAVGLDAAVSEAQAGRLVSALRAADGEIDPLRRSQARVYVLAKAGDLPGAMREARTGLSTNPNDLWLLERSCSLALAMRAADQAQQSLALLDAAVEQSRALDAPDRLRWNQTVAQYSSSAAELGARFAEQTNARTRARRTSMALAGAVMIALWRLARPHQKKPPERSVDSQGRPSSPGFS